MNDSPLPLPRPDEVLSIDYGRLVAQARRFASERVPADDPRVLRWHERVERSRAARAARAATVPDVRVDESLPIAARADEIVAALRAHPVLVVAGETGSGKTTQLPKLCLAAGRGVSGLIGCTQPRRIAARSVARRVASELGTDLGDLVGWQVRFTEQVGARALVKFMTDGILLAETQGDAWLDRYDTLIIDEAHERSLNIDFLLGYLKRLVTKRRDLRVVVTSATIDTARFAEHFGGAPVIAVEGRSYPVEVRYRPPEVLAAAKKGERRGRDDEPDIVSGPAAIVAAADELTREDPLGDVLVFLPGEREIRDAHRALEQRKYRATEILPLYARLSARDQDRVFQPGPGRRIVLATNVAETSLTVPRIRAVIDPGLARINRFSPRHKVQRLQVEPISQASADQRKGRCGRVGPGVCIRLYDEADFAARPQYTEPELLRSSLAGVILRLMALKLGDIDTFPFLERPTPRAIADGQQQLLELGAITADRRALTDVGRTLAKLPIDVKIGRLLIEAQRLGALRDALVVAAFLSIQDPRERPVDAREAADAAHAQWKDVRSDFSTVLKLWEAYRAAHEDLTQSKLRDWCERNFLSFMRMREWRELHRQLLLLIGELGWQQETLVESPDSRTDAVAYERLHRALLSGFPAQVAHKDEKGLYLGTRGRKYAIFPGSTVAKSPPAWLFSATLLETARLYGLMNARVEPHWIEQQNAALLKATQYDPHWARAQGRVVGYERVSLLGLVLVEKRRIDYGKVDPALARQLFVREALATGDIDTRATFVAKNMAVLVRAHEEEARRRRRGLVADQDQLYDWLLPKIPEPMSSTPELERWYRSLDAERRRALEWTLAEVLVGDASRDAEFPKFLRVGTHALDLDYRFEPGHPADGVTLVVPLALLNAVPAARLEWLVPGLLAEKAAELIRSLPKALRRNFVPAPDFARAFVEAAEIEDAPLLPALARHLARIGGLDVPVDAFDANELPPHLRFNIRLLDANGSVLAEGRDLAALREHHGARAREQFARETATAIAREGLVRFDVEEIPREIRTDTGLSAFPALVDTGEAASIRVFEITYQQRRSSDGDCNSWGSVYMGSYGEQGDYSRRRSSISAVPEASDFGIPASCGNYWHRSVFVEWRDYEGTYGHEEVHY